jgi:hypothetical protein
MCAYKRGEMRINVKRPSLKTGFNIYVFLLFILLFEKDVI